MTAAQIKHVDRLKASGFARREIAALTGISIRDLHALSDRRAKMARDAESPRELRELATRLLRRVPSWWEQGSAAWTHCVRMNFCDVLDAA